MRIAITGAASGLGHALRNLADSYELRLADQAAGWRPGQPGPPGTDAIQVVEGDLREPEVARRVVEGCGAVVHLAAHPESWPSDLAADEALDRCARGTFELLRAAVAAGVPRVVLASTLDLLEAYPPGWAVHEGWRPRPQPAMAELGPYLAELSAREFARAGWSLLVVCLRLGRLVGGAVDQGAGGGRVADARSLHVEDAVQAVRRALAFQPASARRAAADGWRRPEDAGWWVFHITGGRRSRFPLEAAAQPAFGYVPQHDFGGTAAAPEARPAYVDSAGRLAPAPGGAPAADRDRPGTGAADAGQTADREVRREVRRVAVFGASGPLGAAAAGRLAAGRTLRLTDVLPPDEGATRIAARWPAAPRPPRLAPPHEVRTVDVSDGAAVLSAAEGMDALLNCSVVREHAAGAFRVNTLGVFNVMRAAVAHGIRRVVHTGPQILSLDHPAGYGTDFGVPDDVPPRAGANVYFHSKYLGMEVCRVFAESYGLEVLALLFSQFVTPEQPGRARGRPGPAAVSWEDAARSLERALDVPAPSPFEMVRILGDLPAGMFSNEKAKRVLGWAPRDSLLHLWQVADGAG